MDIDFNSLSYKIPKPQIKLSNPSSHIYQNSSKIQIKHYLDFQDTQTSNYQQQTSNPFRRTSHLFKHIENEKKLSARTSIANKTNVNHLNDENKIQWSISSRSQPYLPTFPQEPTLYSLENFDSFKNNDSKIQVHVSKEIFQNSLVNKNNLSKLAVSIHQSEFIKIQGSDCQLSDQFSLIMDDFNCQMRCSDILPNKDTRRIKTEYCQIQKQWEEEKEEKLCFDEKKSQRNVRKKQSSGIFFLTAQQEQSSQSNVKQFYFDLRKEQQKLKTTQQDEQINSKSNILPERSIKKQLKQLIYNFIDDIQILDQDQIDPDFLERIQECIFTVKKIPPLHLPCSQITPQKWVKVNKNNSRSNSKEKNRFIPPKPAPTLQCGLTSKMNKQNTMFSKNVVNQSSKKKKPIQQNVSSLFHGEIRKKKWAL